MTTGVDNQHTLAVDAITRNMNQSLPNFRRQRKTGVHIKSQLAGGRNLIDILPARS
jgi:hypothetical protein